MLQTQDIKELINERKIDIGTRFGVELIGIFGSGARDELREGSDVDVLVTIIPERQTFRNYMGLKFFLEDLLGYRVDLVLKDDIRAELNQNILEDLIVV